LNLYEAVTLGSRDDDVPNTGQRLNQAALYQTANRRDGKAHVVRGPWNLESPAFSEWNSVRSTIPLK